MFLFAFASSLAATPAPSELDLDELALDVPPQDGVERPHGIRRRVERSTWLPEEGRVQLRGLVRTGHPLLDDSGGWSLEFREVRLDGCDSEQWLRRRVGRRRIEIGFPNLGIHEVRLEWRLPRSLSTEHTSWRFTLVDRDGETRVDLGQIVTTNPAVHPACP